MSPLAAQFYIGLDFLWYLLELSILLGLLVGLIRIVRRRSF